MLCMVQKGDIISIIVTNNNNHKRFEKQHMNIVMKGNYETHIDPWFFPELPELISNQ